MSLGSALPPPPPLDPRGEGAAALPPPPPPPLDPRGDGRELWSRPEVPNRQGQSRHHPGEVEPIRGSARPPWPGNWGGRRYEEGGAWAVELHGKGNKGRQGGAWARAPGSWAQEAYGKGRAWTSERWDYGKG